MATIRPPRNVDSVTVEDLTIPIDYNDVGAVDPPADTIFGSQVEWDNYLSSQGATNFKHINEVRDAWPSIIAHTITMNVAAGVQRPSGATAEAFRLDKNVLLGGGGIILNGSPPSTYTQIVSSQTVTSHQTGSANPWLAFAGTPFAGLDVKGKLCVIDTGQTAMIHNHDDNTLFLCSELSPAPTDSVTTMFVGRPSTILRNSESPGDDIGGPLVDSAGFYFEDRGGGGYSLTTYTALWMQDIQIDHLGASQGISVGPNAFTWLARVIIDHEYQRTQFARTPNGRDIQFSGDYAWLQSCSGYADAANMGGRDNPVFASGISVALAECYFGNSPKGISANGFGTVTSLYSGTVLENLGATGGRCVEAYFEAKVDFLKLSTEHKRITIRDCVNGVLLGPGCGTQRQDSQELWFEGIVGPCVEMHSGSSIAIEEDSWGTGYHDGGGNLDVGFDLIGIDANLTLGTYTDLVGAVGAVRDASDELSTYAEIEELGPLVDAGFNKVKRE